MSVQVIDTLKPKNNGDFPIVEAEDVEVSEGVRLPEALGQKAEQSDLEELSDELAGKASASELTIATANLQGQIDQIEISASAEAVVAPEVAAARVDSDGVTHATLKARLDSVDTSVQHQFDNVSAAVDAIADTSIENFTLSEKGANKATTFTEGFINKNNEIVQVSTWKYSIAPVVAGKRYIIKTYSGVAICAKIYYDSNFDPVLLEGTTSSTEAQEFTDVIPNGVAYVGINAPILNVPDIGVWENIREYKLDIDEMGNDIKNSDAFNLVLSNNLYLKSLAEDNTLLLYNTGAHSSFEGSIVSGWFPVEEGKKYTITNGGNLYIPTALFYDANKNVICCDDSYQGIDPPTGKVVVSGNKKVRTYEILEGSNIAYISWYISRYENHNYYGEHNGLAGIIDYVQVNEGDVLLPFDEYTIGFDYLDDKIREHSSEISSNTKAINQLINLPLSERVILTKDNNNIQFRSDWDNEYDIAVRCSLNGSNNNSFNLSTYDLIEKTADLSDISSGTLFKHANDDIAPVNFNGSYIGANHGWAKLYILTTGSTHGLTEANIGETWIDSNNNELLILKIPETNKIWVCIPSDDSTNANLAVGTIGSTISKDGQTISINSSELSQIWPAINHASVKILSESGKLISDNGVYKGNYFDIVESYDIIYVPAMIDYLETNVGNNDNTSYYSDAINEKYCTVSIIYRFTERGAITVFESIDFSKSVQWRFGHFVQSMTIGDYAVVPNSNYYTPTLIGDGIDLTPNTWLNENVPPARYYQYSDNTLEKGMCIGFNEEYGNARPSVQKDMTSVGFYYGLTKKVYPQLSCLFRSVNADDNINAICYRVPIGDYDADVSTGWYYINDDIYILLDAQKSVNKFVKLPEYMNGMKVAIVESFGSIEFPIPFISSNGIKVIVNNYGSAILKLSK